MKMQNSEAIKELLQGNKNQVPSESYFSGVLSEFHKRQRLNQLQKKSIAVQLREFLADMWFFQPARLVQVSAMSVFVLFFTLNGIRDSWSSASATLASFENSQSTSSDEHFLISSAIDQLGSSALNQSFELASSVANDSNSGRTQYVSNTVPLSADTVVAF